MNPNELTPYGEALEKIIELQDLLIEEQKEVLRLMGEVEELKDKDHCCPDCGCHFVGEYPFNYKVKELTDEEIREIWEIVSLKWWDWENSFDVTGFARAILRKAQEK
jgi:DNA repair exonuclease SbcCD ATPase subunit